MEPIGGEELREGFPALSLAQVYGAIAYYLDHQASLDAGWADDDLRAQRQREQARRDNPALYARLDERRARLHQRLAYL